MKRRYFGTDGVRGKVGSSPITPDFVMKLGQAAGRVLKRHNPTGRASVLIGKDTRVSGYMLEAALQAGFSSAGVDVVLCGPIPTPAVAYLTRAQRLDAGVVISASHNPYDDNGIKFFSAAGQMLSVCRTYAAIDVEAVRRIADRNHIGAKLMKDIRRNVIGRTVGAVDEDLQAL